jgi:hypothetical protein
MTAQLRSRLLMAALALSLAATAWVASREEASSDQASNSGSARLALAKPALPLGWPAALLAPVAGDGPAWAEPDAVARQSWGLAATAAAPTAEAEAPTDARSAKADRAAEQAPPAAPPIAYSLVGRMDEAGRPRIVLSNAQRTLVLGVGELIDEQWRIVAIDPTGAQLLWLAGGQKQNLAYSSP